MGPTGSNSASGDPLHDPLGERVGDLEIADGRMIANSSPPVRHTSSLWRTDRPELVGELGQHLVSDGVPVDVVDALEVVEIEHQQRHRPALGGACERARSGAARGRPGGSRAR